MNVNLTRSAGSLRDAFYALSLAGRIPDSELLDDVVRHYPQHAEALTAFAIELALDAHRNDRVAEVAEAKVDLTMLNPAVSRAMSRFQNRLHSVQQGTSIAGQNRSSPAVDVVNPFATLDRTSFRSVATRLNANTMFVVMLRDRQIDSNTMTDGFRRHVADVLKAPLDLVVAHFAAQGTGSTQVQFYKADEKPGISDKRSFAEAIASCALSEEQQKILLAL